MTFGGSLPGEQAGSFSSLLQKIVASDLLAGNLEDPIGPEIFVSWVEQDASVSDDFGKAGSVRGHRNRAAGHRFQGWNAEPFMPRRIKQRDTLAVQVL